MKSLYKIIKEQFDYLYLIRRLSAYEIKEKNRNSYLGSAWEIINLMIQLFIYWFVFQNVRQRSNIELSDGSSVPFFYWLLAGFILWMFFYKATLEASRSIYTRIKVISKMSFPKSIVPSYVIASHLYIHIVVIVLAAIVLNIGGFGISLHYIQLLYFIPATLMFLFAFALITSTISAIARDAHQLLGALMRMGLYLSPILWEVGKIGEPYSLIVKANPVYYLIEGYRAAFFGTEWYMVAHWEYSLYFWGLVLFIFFIGAKLHLKFRRHLIDFA